ncbi:MAG: SprB repeat-containing protein, partial [Saprospiraceae bacterium]|nr:SprB repeat-containing protein [Saprospiraceae bacterium]
MRLDTYRSLTALIIFFGIISFSYAKDDGIIKSYRLSDNTVVKVAIHDFTCDNITNGGAIAGDEIGCPNPIFDPTKIVNIQLPSGGSGAIEYIWMFTTEDPNKPVATWNPIPNTNSFEYDPGPINVTTYFIRCSRRAGCTLYTGETNYVKKEVKCCPGNVTDGGLIGPDQNSCTIPYNPSIINNIQLPTGGGGTIIYEWLVSNVGGSVNNGTWAVIGGANGNSYDPPIIDKTTYYVRRATVELCNGWEYSNTVKITVTDGVSLSNTKTHPSCFEGKDGTISITVLKGQSPFMYKWSNNNNNSSFQNNLGGGTYTVTVTDANGCTAKEIITLNDPPEILISGNSTPTTCFGGFTGKVNISVSGGTPNYSFLWSSGEVSQNISNKSAGTYTVTVTDSKSCSKVKSFTIQDAPEINFTTSINHNKCFNDNKGSIQLNVSGGTPSYSYIWSNGSTNNPATNLTAGNYTFTITDSNGCKKIGNAIVNNGPQINVAGSVSNVTCFGQNNGFISLTVSGGTPNYTYKWSNGPVTKDLANVVAGNYSVTITDANACTSVQSFVVSQPNDLVVTGISTNPACFNSTNGSVDVSVSGGTSPYTYMWNGVAGNQDLNNAPAGTY